MQSFNVIGVGCLVLGGELTWGGVRGSACGVFGDEGAWRRWPFLFRWALQSLLFIGGAIMTGEGWLGERGRGVGSGGGDLRGGRRPAGGCGGGKGGGSVFFMFGEY